MGMPHVTSCCWCLGLEVGAKVVAYLHLLVSASLVVVCSVFAAQAGALAGTAEDAGDALYTRTHRAALAVALLSVGHVLLAGTLLYGVYKRSSRCLRGWVCLMSVLLVAALALVVANVALTGLAGQGSDIFLAFLEGVLFFGVMVYCILCVHSYYLMLRSIEDMEGPRNTPY